MMKSIDEIRSAIRDIPDFPKAGIMFKDVTPLLKDARLFKKAVDLLAKQFEDKKIDKVASIESRGFIFGAAIAYKLGASFVPIRKKGKLPHLTYFSEYELEYGKDILEVHQDAIGKGENVLIIDDLLATGGTLSAAIDLVQKTGGKIAGIGFLIELTFLRGREKHKGREIFSLVKY